MKAEIAVDRQAPVYKYNRSKILSRAQTTRNRTIVNRKVAIDAINTFDRR